MKVLEFLKTQKKRKVLTALSNDCCYFSWLLRLRLHHRLLLLRLRYCHLLLLRLQSLLRLLLLRLHHHCHDDDVSCVFYRPLHLVGLLLPL
jgi:hypothetical protein